MFDIKTDNTKLHYSFSSRMEMIDRLLPIVMEFIEEFSEDGSTRYLALVLRELLCNAIEHGNESDMSKLVTGAVEKIGICRYKLVVTDEGSGWDDSDVSFQSSPDSTAGRSMGYTIVNNYCDELSFAKDSSTVTAYLGLQIETTFEVKINSDHYLIEPSGDISATISEPFRDALLQWFDSENETCTIDFTNIESIDSI